MSDITKWKIYCNTENKYITGFLDNNISQPNYCFHNNTHSIDTSRTKFLENIHRDYTKTLVKWKIFCDTENIDTYGYLDENVYPTNCFNNNEHVVSKLPVELEKIHNNKYGIKEEYVETGGHFKAQNYKMICPVGESIHDYSFKFNISALTIKINTLDIHRDDELVLEVGPDTIIGAITSNVNMNDTIINVSPTVIDYIEIGYYVTLDNGINTESLGQVLSIDKINYTITVENQSTKAFLYTTPTYVKMTVRVIDNFTIGYPGMIEIGSGKIGGSHIPKDTIIRVRYQNNNITSKAFYANLELLY